jgi:hypothetical protein
VDLLHLHSTKIRFVSSRILTFSSLFFVLIVLNSLLKARIHIDFDCRRWLLCQPLIHNAERINLDEPVTKKINDASNTDDDSSLRS